MCTKVYVIFYLVDGSQFRLHIQINLEAFKIQIPGPSPPCILNDSFLVGAKGSVF